MDLNADGGAVRAIADLARDTQEGQVLEEDGKRFLYSGGSLHPITWDPQPEEITVGSLDGLIQFLLEKAPFPLEELLAVVQGVGQVVVFGPMSLKTKKRPVVAKAVLDKNLETFQFGSFMDQETFLISFYAQMKRDDADFKVVVEYASHVVQDEGLTLTDDGVTQSAVVKSGLKGGSGETRQDAPSIVTLTPFRTFRELSQPQGMFVFRMKKSQNGIVFALFEADGGAWRLDAAQRIGMYLKSSLANVTIA